MKWFDEATTISLISTKNSPRNFHSVHLTPPSWISRKNLHTLSPWINFNCTVITVQLKPLQFTGNDQRVQIYSLSPHTSRRHPVPTKTSVFHLGRSVRRAFLPSDCLLLDVVLSLQLALVFGTLFLPTSLQHLLCSLSENV